MERLQDKVEGVSVATGNPQLEDGHTRIANELLDAIIRFDFGKRHYKVVLFVLRKTYGWNKRADVMSLSQIMEGTGLARSHACDAVNDLVEQKVLLKQEHRSGQLIEINKKYKQWVVLPKREHVTETVTKVLPKREFTVTETVTTKDTTKRQLKTSIPNSFGISERVRSWAEKHGHHSLELHLENFISACRAKGYRYIDWDEAFMTAIRKNWAAIPARKERALSL